MQQHKSSTWRVLNRDGTFNVVPTQKGINWTDVYHGLLSITWRRFISVIITTYFSINLCFGLGYFLCSRQSFAGITHTNNFRYFLDCFFFSVQTFATIGYGRIAPVGIVPNVLVTLEALMGLLCISLATGLFFVRFSKPTARVVFSETAIVTMIDQVPCLLFRIANMRNSYIAQAQMSAVLAVNEKTQEGESYRNLYDLELERSTTPAFTISWTIVHPINESSPIKNHTQESLTKGDAEILVTLTGVDDTFAQSIRARFSYAPEEIVWNKRFVDIMSRDAQGRIQIDMQHFHDYV